MYNVRIRPSVRHTGNIFTSEPPEALLAGAARGRHSSSFLVLSSADRFSPSSLSPLPLQFAPSSAVGASVEQARQRLVALCVLRQPPVPRTLLPPLMPLRAAARYTD